MAGTEEVVKRGLEEQAGAISQRALQRMLRSLDFIEEKKASKGLKMMSIIQLAFWKGYFQMQKKTYI